MDQQPLRQLLEQLHTELSRTQALDAEARAQLRKLMAEVQAILERTEEAPDQQYQSLSGQLQQAIKQFEISHPQLTWAMGEVLDILSRSGV